MKKTVLVTGATGFIGRHCTRSLLPLGYEIHATTSKGSQDNPASVSWHHVDLLDPPQITALMGHVQPTHLLHFAWSVPPGQYWTSLENVRWVQASLDLIQAFIARGGQRMVVAGTCAEYDWSYGYCSEHITPLIPTTLYGTCKHSLHLIVDALARQMGISTAWGRIFFLYGPYEHHTRLVASVISSLLRGQPAPCSHGNQIRDFLYVQDAADAFAALLDSNVMGSVNIASGLPITLKDIAQAIGEAIQQPDLIKLGALTSPENEPRVLLANVNRLAKEVGWVPKYSLNDGLSRTISWWQHHPFNGSGADVELSAVTRSCGRIGKTTSETID